MRANSAIIVPLTLSLLTAPLLIGTGLAQQAKPAAKPQEAGKPAQAAAPKAPANTPIELEADRIPKIVTKGSCLIRNGTLLTVTKGIVANGDILVQNGKIAAIGKNLTAPLATVIIDATGKFVTPGIVDAHSHIALDDTNEGSDSITAEVNMRDVVDPQSVEIYRGLSNGVTTSLLLHGSANPIGGQSVVVKMKWKRPVEELFVPDAPRMIKFALGENVKQSNFGGGGGRFPNTRMGVEAVYRRGFEAAKLYTLAWAGYEKQRDINPDAVPPRRDLRLETLADILNGKIWVQCHSYRADEMLMMTRLSQEFHFKLAALQHGLEGYKVAPEIAKAGVGVSTFADAWAYKQEAFDAIPYNAALCLRAGIVTSVNSDNSSGTYRLNLEAANCIKYGDLTENEALRLVTINPAIQLGVDRRTGSLEIGKDADICLWDGNPLSVYSKCVLTMVEGEVYYQRRDTFGVDKQALHTSVLPVHPGDFTNQPAPPVGRRAYAIVGGTVHPIHGPDIVGGTVVIADGRIVSVGKNVSMPNGTFVVNAKGLHVYPGLIDSGSILGLNEIDSIRATRDSSENGDYQPDLIAATAVNPGSVHLAVAYCCGITASLVCPSGGVIGGQASVMNLAGWTTELMKVSGQAALRINFPGGGLNRFERAFLPPEAQQEAREQQTARVRTLREYFDRAKRYAAARKVGAAGVGTDLALEAMQPYLAGKLPVVFDVATAVAARRAIAFGEEYGLKIVLSGGSDIWKAADLLAKKKIPYIFTVPTDNSLGSTVPTEDYDPTDTTWTAPAILQRAGVNFCFQTQTAASANNLPRQVGIFCAYGLPHDAALRGLTLTAAETLGVADKMGSLEAGKIANVIVTDGDPLEITTHVRTLFIAGKPITLENKHTRLYNLYKQRLTEKP